MEKSNSSEKAPAIVITAVIGIIIAISTGQVHDKTATLIMFGLSIIFVGISVYLFVKLKK